jgi:hypothetical protein
VSLPARRARRPPYPATSGGGGPFPHCVGDKGEVPALARRPPYTSKVLPVRPASNRNGSGRVRRISSWSRSITSSG